MILADSSIWIDHFKVANLALSRALDNDELVVLGELALGSLRNREQMLLALSKFDRLAVVAPDEILNLVEKHKLFSRGIGYIDVHLLASCVMTGNCKLLTRDTRLHRAATEFGVAA